MNSLIFSQNSKYEFFNLVGCFIYHILKRNTRKVKTVPLSKKENKGEKYLKKKRRHTSPQREE